MSETQRDAMIRAMCALDSARLGNVPDAQLRAAIEAIAAALAER